MRIWFLVGSVGCLQAGCGASKATVSESGVGSSSPSAPSENATGGASSLTTQPDAVTLGPFAPPFDFSSMSEFTGERPPIGAPPILQEQDPCAIVECTDGRGCCHNPLATELNAFPREFLVDCLPEGSGQVNAPLDSTCEDYRCETSYCLWKGCRLDSGQCGVQADEYVVQGGVDVHAKTVKVDLGCLDERWLIRRNPSGVPPDPTLECAVDYWWPEAGSPSSGVETAHSTQVATSMSSDGGVVSDASVDAQAIVASDAAP